MISLGGVSIFKNVCKSFENIDPIPKDQKLHNFQQLLKSKSSNILSNHGVVMLENFLQTYMWSFHDKHPLIWRHIEFPKFFKKMVAWPY